MHIAIVTNRNWLTSDYIVSRVIWLAVCLAEANQWNSREGPRHRRCRVQKKIIFWHVFLASLALVLLSATLATTTSQCALQLVVHYTRDGLGLSPSEWEWVWWVWWTEAHAMPRWAIIIIIILLSGKDRRWQSCYESQGVNQTLSESSHPFRPSISQHTTPTSFIGVIESPL